MNSVSDAILTIGMPVYNGEAYLNLAIQSLLSQDFKRWELLIVDNHSTDASWDIINSYALYDSRITCIRREKNIGAAANFIGLVEMTKSPYFMWAAADDTWSNNYISSCLEVLEEHAEVGLSGGAIQNTDANGNVIRIYESFFGFSDKDTRVRIVSYLRATEVDGKANIIYSVFRTDLIKTVCAIRNIFTGWGADMAFVLAAISRMPYMQVGQSTLFKRMTSSSDVQTAKLISCGLYNKIQYGGNFPFEYFYSYVRALIRGVSLFRLKFFVINIMLYRLICVSFRKGLGEDK